MFFLSHLQPSAILLHNTRSFHRSVKASFQRNDLASENSMKKRMWMSSPAWCSLLDDLCHEPRSLSLQRPNRNVLNVRQGNEQKNAEQLPAQSKYQIHVCFSHYSFDHHPVLFWPQHLTPTVTQEHLGTQPFELYQEFRVPIAPTRNNPIKNSHQFLIS